MSALAMGRPACSSLAPICAPQPAAREGARHCAWHSARGVPSIAPQYPARFKSFKSFSPLLHWRSPCHQRLLGHQAVLFSSLQETPTLSSRRSRRSPQTMTRPRRRGRRPRRSAWAPSTLASSRGCCSKSPSNKIEKSSGSGFDLGIPSRAIAMTPFPLCSVCLLTA